MLSGLVLPADPVLATVRLPILASVFPVAWWVIGIVSALVACGTVYVFLGRQRGFKSASAPSAERPPVRSPFDELIDGHELSSSEVGLLRQAAKQLELPQPILLFVDPALLDRFVESCDCQSEALALRQKLFGVQLESNADSAASVDDVAADLLGDLSTVEPASETEPAAASRLELVQ